MGSGFPSTSPASVSRRLLILAPTRRAASETFIRANLERLPFLIDAYFGDEVPWDQPRRCLYGVAVLISKLLSRLGLLRLASLPPSAVALLLIRHHQPDLVLVEFGFHAVRVMELAAWCNRPMVVHFRGADASADRYLKRLQHRYRRLLTLTSAVIVKSEVMQRTLTGLGVGAQPVLISPSGADERRFHGAAPADNPPRFLAVGRFVEKKGPLETLEAFRILRESHPLGDQASLVMVGAGPLLEPVRRRVLALGLDGSVCFPGMLAPEDVADQMRQARAFLQHSRTAADGDQEGCPVAVMEAQLCGLPVVATLHGGIPDVVRHGVSGFLVPEGDVRGMADAMLRLTVDPALAQTMGSAGRDQALSSYTVQHHIDQISALLKSLMRSL